MTPPRARGRPKKTFRPPEYYDQLTDSPDALNPQASLQGVVQGNERLQGESDDEYALFLQYLGTPSGLSRIVYAASFSSLSLIELNTLAGRNRWADRHKMYLAMRTIEMVANPDAYSALHAQIAASTLVDYVLLREHFLFAMSEPHGTYTPKELDQLVAGRLNLDRMARIAAKMPAQWENAPAPINDVEQTVQLQWEKGPTYSLAGDDG